MKALVTMVIGSSPGTMSPPTLPQPRAEQTRDFVSPKECRRDRISPIIRCASSQPTTNKVMQLVALALCSLVVFAAAHPIDDWTSFKTQYGKSYESTTEEDLRMQIWRDHSNFIIEHNKRNATFTMAMNQFGDLVRRTTV